MQYLSPRRNLDPLLSRVCPPPPHNQRGEGGYTLHTRLRVKGVGESQFLRLELYRKLPPLQLKWKALVPSQRGSFKRIPNMPPFTSTYCFCLLIHTWWHILPNHDNLVDLVDSLSMYIAKKSHCIPLLGIARPQSQFPHSCVCERFIYSQD